MASNDGAPAGFDPPRIETGAESEPQNSAHESRGEQQQQRRLRDAPGSTSSSSDRAPSVPDQERHERLRDRVRLERQRDAARDAQQTEPSVVERLGERASEGARSRSAAGVVTPVKGAPRPEEATGREVGAAAILDESRRRSNRARRGRRVVQLLLVAFVALIFYYATSLWQVYSTGRSDEARSVDAIVVMGAAQYDGVPSPQLAARLDHVVELWPEGYADTVVVTGGNQPGDRFTEAEASAAYLTERGVPEDAIVFEDVGATSYESLDRVADFLAVREGSSVLIVTDPYHALRSRLIAQEVGLTAYVSPTRTSVVTGLSSLQRHAWEAGGVTVGRVTGFDWLNRVMG